MADLGVKQSIRVPRFAASSLASHVGLTALSALLLLLCFPWPGWGWVAYVALVPLGVLAVRSQRPGRLAWVTTVVMTLGFWLPRISWLIPVTIGGWLGACLTMTCYFGVAAYAMNRITRRLRLPMVITLPLVWVSMEFLRGYFPFTGFGWLALAHTQGSYQLGQSAGRVAQVADLFGEQTIAIVVAMTNGLIVDLITRPIFKPIGAGKRRVRRTLRGGLILWGVVFFGAIIYGQYRISQTDDVVRPGPRVAVVQTNVPQSNKNARTDAQAAQDWADLGELTRTAADAATAPDLIVWPETTVPAALNPQALALYRRAREDPSLGWGGFDGDQLHQQIQRLARALDVPLLVGAPSYEDFVRVTGAQGRSFQLPGKRFNSVFLYDARGRRVGERYDKMFLVPFGEYIPLGDTLPWIKSLFMVLFSPYPVDYTVQHGDRVQRYTLPFAGASGEVAAGSDGDASGDGGSFRFATPICYEDAISRVCLNMVYGSDPDQPGRVKKVDALINLTNSAWYSGDSQRPQELQMAALRCIENRVPMARAVNSGTSAIIDSAGRVIAVVRDAGGARQRVAGTVAGELPLDPRRTLYGRVGAWPMTLLVLLTLGLLIAALLRGPRRRR